MANYKKKKKVKKFEAGGMSELARRAPEGFLRDAKDRLEKRRRDMMMEGMGRALREATPPPRQRGGARKAPRSPLSDVARAAMRGKEMAEEMKKLPKDSAEYARMKKAQEMAGAAMKAAPSRGASGMKKGGKVKKGYHKMPDGRIMKDSAHKGMKKGGKVSSCSKRADGCAVRGKTKGRMV